MNTNKPAPVSAGQAAPAGSGYIAMADALREIFERRPCDYDLDMQKVRDADMATLMRVHHLFAAQPAEGAGQAGQAAASFDAWWQKPNERTGHPPSATLDPYSARNAWDAAIASIATERAAAPAELTVAARDVLAERRRQVEQEGWTPEHDDQYDDAELSRAAAAYALQGEHDFGPPPEWPWSRDWWKPRDERRNLVKAGALILADIERLDRATHQPSAQKGGA